MAKEGAGAGAGAASWTLLVGDCRALRRKNLVSESELRAWEAVLSCEEPEAHKVGEIRSRVAALFQEEADALVDRVRVQQNEQEREGFANTDLLAVAAGGALGALNAWLRPAPAQTTTATTSTATTTTSAASSLWASAFDGAAASLNVARRKRHVEHLKLELLSGDPSACEHVVLCINGFMTQRDDPSKNWKLWCRTDLLHGAQGPDQPQEKADNVAVYAVRWEAGDAAAWNDFCTHVNDQLGSASTSTSASALIAHFSGNPWHSAQQKAEQVGLLLARVLAQGPSFLRLRRLSLLGHSLGGAVIYSTFQELAKLRAKEVATEGGTQHVPLVANAVGFAGAFVPDAQGLENIASGLEPDGGRFVNVFSTRDGVLSKLFWALQLPGPNGAAAAGCEALEMEALGDRGVNVDVSDLIPPRVENHFGHGYGHYMEAIQPRILHHLKRR